MDAQDIRNLSEAYMNVYEEVDKRRAPKELVDRLNASREGHMAQDGPNKPAYDAKQRLLKKAQKRKNMEEQVDLYDIILSHLLDEGYAETPEAAEVIMVNMGEEWRESIVEFSQTELNSVSSSINQNTRNASIRKQQPGFQSSQSEPQRPTGVPIPGTARVFNTVKKVGQAVVGSALK